MTASCCRAATRVAVHFGENHARDPQALVEFVGRVDRILPGHGIGHEQYFDRVQQSFELLKLFHQLIVDVQSTGGIDDKHIAARDRCLAACFLRQALDHRSVRLAIDFSFIKIRADRL